MLKFQSFLLLILMCSQMKANDLGSNLNVMNGPLDICSLDPLTGFTRSGRCEVFEGDQGNSL